MFLLRIYFLLGNFFMSEKKFSTKKISHQKKNFDQKKNFCKNFFKPSKNLSFLFLYFLSKVLFSSSGIFFSRKI